MKRKLFFHWDGNVSILSEAEKEIIKEKTKRRAKRYFETGVLPGHRVVASDPTSVTLAYRRTTGGPVTIRWRWEEVTKKPSPKKVAKKVAKRAKRSAKK